MRIGIISDTHDRLPMMDRALAFFADKPIEALCHPGDIIAPFAARKFVDLDIPFHVTYGNNDGERAGLKAALPQIQDGPLSLDLGGKRVLLHHFIDWCQDKDVESADIIITGHTHEVVTEKRNGKLFLNPGECCGWVNNRCTVALLDTEDLSVDIIELKP